MDNSLSDTDSSDSILSSNDDVTISDLSESIDGETVDLDSSLSDEVIGTDSGTDTDNVQAVFNGSDDEISSDDTSNGPDGSDILAESETVDIYVSDSAGNDETGDGTIESPYKTVYKALDGLTSYSNDVINIHIASGTYIVNQNMMFSCEGNSVNLIGDEYNNVFFDANASQESYNFAIDSGVDVSFNNISFINFYLQDMCMIQNDGTLLMNNCRFENNTYSTERLALTSVIVNTGNLTITGSKFLGSGLNNTGTLIYNTNGNLNIFESEFRNFTLRSQNLNSVTKNSFINMVGGDLLNITNSIFENVYSYSSRNDHPCILINVTNATTYFTNCSVSDSNVTDIVYSTSDVYFSDNDISNILTGSSQSYVGSIVHAMGNLTVSNNDFTNISRFENIVYANHSLIAFNNNLTNISNGYYIIYANINIDYEYLIDNNNVKDIYNQTYIVYCAGKNGTVSITNNDFEDIVGKIKEYSWSSGSLGVLTFYNRPEYSVYLQNNTIESLTNISAIYIDESSRNPSNFTINLNVSVDTYMDKVKDYEVRVTDDMGNEVTIYGGSTPSIARTPNAFMYFYFNETQVAYSNVTDGVAYIHFVDTVENGEYNFIINASFLSNESNVPTTVILNISHRDVDIYVSDVDGNDETGDGSIENPYKSLKRAFDDVGANDRVTIHLAAGNYTDENNYNISAFLNHTLWEGKLSIVGEDLENTRMGASNSTFMFSNDTNVYVNNVTLVSSFSKNGGNVVIENCKFEYIVSGFCNLTIVNSAGSIYNISSNDTYILNSSLFADIVNVDWISSANSLIIENSTISNLTTYSWDAEFLYSNNITLLNSEFSHFDSMAVAVYGYNIFVDNCTFSDIKMVQNNVPGIIEVTGGDCIFTNSKFIDCSNAPVIKTDSASSIQSIDNCTFINCSNNGSSTYYGAILNVKNANITNCVFTDSSDETQGVIYLSNRNLNLNIVNNIFNNSYAKDSNNISFCIYQEGAITFLKNNTVIADESIPILAIREPNSNFLSQTNLYATFINKTINSTNAFLYINITDDMGNPITFIGSKNRNISFMLSGELMGYAGIVNGISSCQLPKIIDNGEYEFTGSIPFASADSNIQFTNITVDFDLDTISKLYVSTAGSDEDGDGTESNPFKTINKAIEYGFSNALIVEVYIKEGVYSGLGNTNLTIDKLGYLTLISVDGFNKTVIDGENINKFFDISSKLNLKMLNLSFVNANIEKINNSAAIYSLGDILIENCIFENLTGNESAAMIYSSGNMDLINSVFINKEDSVNSAICINGGESYLRNNTMINFDGVNGSIYVKSGLINAVVTFMDNSTFNVGGPKLYLRATVTDDMGNTISGGTLTFRFDESLVGSFTVNKGIVSFNSQNSYEGEHLFNGSYSFASEDAIVKTAFVTFVPNYELVSLYVATDGSDELGDGSEANPFKTINGSLAYGFSQGYNLAILIKEGIYSGLGNTNLTMNYGGNVSLIGVDGYNKTIIDANNSTFFTINSNNYLDLVNLTFTNSLYKASNANYAPIHNVGNLTISECIFENHVRNWYGTLYNEGTLIVENTIFNNFSATPDFGTGDNGGIIYSTGNENCRLEIFNSKFYNSNNMMYGGAIFVSGMPFVIQNCEFVNCSATRHSGAIRVAGSNKEGIIKNNYFYNCTATSPTSTTTGEAIHAINYVYLENNTMIDCNKTNNPIYARYTNAIFYIDDVYTEYKYGFAITGHLEDDKGNLISTNNNNKITVVINGEEIISSNTISTGKFDHASYNKSYENGVYEINGTITGIDGDGYYDVIVRNGTLIVNKTFNSPVNIYVNNNTGDDNGEGNLTNPFKTLSKAIEFAAAESNNPTIIIESVDVGEGYVNLTFENFNNLTLYGWNVLFNGEGSNWIFKFNNITNLNIEGINFENAKSDDSGSAIFVSNVTFTNISSCSFINNTAKEGGAIYIEGDGSLDGLTFINNSAEVGAAIRFNGDVVVNRTIFDNNKAITDNAIYYSGNYAGETNFWDKNYLSREEFINANLLVKGTGGTNESQAPENWVIVNSEIKSEMYSNTRRIYNVFFSYLDGNETISMPYYRLHIVSVQGNTPDEVIDLDNGSHTIDYWPHNDTDDTVTIYSMGGNPIVEYNIHIKEYKNMDVIYVSNDGDDDLGNGTYDAPFKSLDLAFTYINNNGTIFIKGTYTGALTIDKNLTLSAYDGEAILDGLNSTQIMNIPANWNGQTNVTLYGLTFINGRGNYGALHSDWNTFVTIDNCKFLNNNGTNNAFYLHEGIINNCQFINNLGSEKYNSSNSAKSIIGFYRGVTVTDTSFINNFGYLIFYLQGSPVIFENCEFINNTCNACIDRASTIPTLSILNCKFENTTGCAIDGGYRLDLEGTSFINNHIARGSGAALYLSEGNAVITDCIFINNSGNFSAGAIYLQGGASAYISGCIFVNNSANNAGGAIYSQSTIIIENSIFDGNSAPNGSAVVVFRNVLDNSLLDNNYWGNSYVDAEEFNASGVFAFYDNSYVGFYENTAPNTWINLIIDSDDNIDKGTTKEYTVSLNTLNDGTVLEDEYLPDYTVFITDALGNIIPCEVLITEGVGTFTYDGSNAGKDTISVYSTLVPDHLLLTKDISVTIPATTELTVPETSLFGEEIPISIKVEAIDGSTVEGSIALYVNGEKLIDLVLENGIASYNLTVESTGTYEITAELISDFYASANESSTVTVTKAISVLSIDDFYAMIGDNVVMNIKLSDVAGNPLAGDISITLPDGTVVNMTIDGMTSYDFGTFDEAGNISVSVEFAGDENYEGASATGVIVVYGEGNVLVKHTEAGDAADIQAAIDAANPGDIIRLGDYDYTNVSGIVINKDITISAEGASISSTGDGTPIFNIPAISENGPENVAITGVDFILSNGDTVVKATADNDTNPLSIVTPSINITDNTFELANETTVPESITILELDSERGVLSPTGEISISGNEIAAGVDPFDFKVTSIGSGDEINITHQNFTPEKKATVIVYSDMSTTAVDMALDGRVGEWFKFKLTDADGNPLANMPMEIGFNGKIYNYENDGIITDENGTAQLQINLGSIGSNTFAISFIGNDEYNASFAVARINVTAQKGIMTVPNKSYKASAKTKALTATLKSASGKAIKNKVITFDINGKTYTAKTDAKGVATVNVSISKKGTYKYTVKFANDVRYAAITKKATLTVK